MAAGSRSAQSSSAGIRPAGVRARGLTPPRSHSRTSSETASIAAATPGVDLSRRALRPSRPTCESPGCGRLRRRLRRRTRVSQHRQRVRRTRLPVAHARDAVKIPTLSRARGRLASPECRRQSGGGRNAANRRSVRRLLEGTLFETPAPEVFISFWLFWIARLRDARTCMGSPIRLMKPRASF